MVNPKLCKSIDRKMHFTSEVTEPGMKLLLRAFKCHQQVYTSGCHQWHIHFHTHKNTRTGHFLQGKHCIKQSHILYSSFSNVNNLLAAVTLTAFSIIRIFNIRVTGHRSQDRPMHFTILHLSKLAKCIRPVNINIYIYIQL